MKIKYEFADGAVSEVEVEEVCWRGQDYCITWVDGEACRIEKE